MGTACKILALATALVVIREQCRCCGLQYPHPARPHGWSWGGGGGGGGGGSGADYQVVYLPALVAREAQYVEDDGDIGAGARDADAAIDYSFDALGRNFELKLVPNRRLLSPHFKVFTSELEGERHEEELSEVGEGCHYLHSGGGAVAAISACQDRHLHGIIFADNSTYELRPLSGGARRRGPWPEPAEGGGGGWSEGRARRLPHVIRRAPPLPALHDDALPLRDVRHLHAPPRRARDHSTAAAGPYTIEVALFFDEAAYKIFYPYFNYNERDLRDMLLAYVNGVQALYHHPSLGTRIELSLVRLQLMRAQPPQLPTHGGERSLLLDSFCDYQRTLNTEDDAHPDHWDMALLLSGLDFYALEGGRRSGVTMGLAPVGGVCLAPHACVIAELGATDPLGRPYPSSGFTSVYILAHEIGHNLGMHHDSSGNACARDGFIMSPSRGTSGEAVWSRCSAQVVAQLGWASCLQDRAEAARSELAHERHGDAPGAAFGAKRQCELLLRDRDAAPAAPTSPSAPAPDLCRQLQCRSPHRAGFYYAGPALPGTVCGHNMWCQGGECVRGDGGGGGGSGAMGGGGGVGAESEGWSAWHEGACRSGCVVRARGHRERRRACAGERCEGAGYDVVLCDDTKVCGKKTRVSANELASRKCAEFASKLPELDARGGGLQAPHDPTRMWMGCAVFCRRAGGGGFYAPRVELNDVGADPYFPDGTWCHHDGSQNYYCLQHHCLPENFKMTAHWHIWELPGDDMPGAFNARAGGGGVGDGGDALRRYMSLDEGGAPLLRWLRPEDVPPEPEQRWEVLDYVELPEHHATE